MISKEKGDKTNSLLLCSYLNKIIKSNTIIIVDGGDFAATASYILQPRGPLKWIDPGAFGTLGVGAGFALGAKLCYPDHDVIIMYGDGSLGYSIIEYDTFTRHNLKIISIVGNNASWEQILREQIHILKDDVACPLEWTRYDQMVKPLGGLGIHIENNSELSKLEMIDKLKDDNRSILFNVFINKTSFRDGSISV